MSTTKGVKWGILLKNVDSGKAVRVSLALIRAKTNENRERGENISPRFLEIAAISRSTGEETAKHILAAVLKAVYYVCGER